MRTAVAVLTLLALASRAPAQDVAPAQPFLALEPSGHTAKIWRLAFTPDGMGLVTAAHDKTIRVWDLSKGVLRKTLRPPIGPGRDGRLYALAVSPDGRTIAAGGYGTPAARRGRILLIDLEAGEVRKVLDGHTDVVWDVAFSPDGRRLASGSDDFTARVWDLTSGRTEQILRGHRQRVMKVAFAPDSARLATASYDATVGIWDVATGQRLARMEGHTKQVQVVAWSPDGRTVASGGMDQILMLWNADGSRRRAFPNRANQLLALAFTADSRRLLYTLGGELAQDFTCRFLDLASGQDRIAFAKHSNTVLGAALSPNGVWAATTGGDSPDTYVWRTDTGAVVHDLAGRGRSLRAAGWSADGRTIAWGSKREPKWFFEQELQRAFRVRPQPNADDLKLAPAPDPRAFGRARVQDGDLMLVPGGNTTVNVLRANQLVAKLNTPGDDDYVACFTLLGPGRAAVGSLLGLFLYDVNTGRLLRRFQGHTSTVFDVAPSSDGQHLLSASEDQTLRVWRPDRDEPVLSLFVAGDEWVAWTPEGYYAASPGGEKLMGWHVNNGAERLASFHPAERFRRTLYRPDVLRRLLADGSLEVALANADAARGRKTEPTQVGRVLPPRVELRPPAVDGRELAPAEAAGFGFTAPQARVEVKAAAQPQPGNAVAAMRLLVDGRPYDGPGGTRRFAPPSAEKAEATWTVELTPGRHELIAVADGTASQGFSTPVVVRYVGGTTEKTGPRLFLLAVGVATYQDATLALDYAAKDAEAIARTFQEKSNPLPFRNVQPTVLTDQNATRGRILGELSNLAKAATPDDCVVVHFSGHGKRDADGLLYLLPHDVDQTNLVGTGLASSQVRDMLSLIKGRVLLVLDACHSGAAGRNAQRAASAAAVGEIARELGRDDNGVIVMCSSLGAQESQETRAFKQGIYTQAVLEGLTGKGARAPDDGLVYQAHLHAYVVDRVRQLSRGEQTATIAIPGNLPPLPLSKP